MKYRQFARQAKGVRTPEAQIMIGHPNNSGLQMDQLTQLYIPAFFVNELRLWQDDSLVLSVMDGGSRSPRSQYPLHLCFEWREAIPRRSQRYHGQVFRTNGRSIPGPKLAALPTRS